MNRLLSILGMLPGIIQYIEIIHGNAKNGAEKKDLAMQSLGLATTVADGVMPEHKQEIDAYAMFTSNMIDATVALLNQTKQMPKPAPAPTV